MRLAAGGRDGVPKRRPAHRFGCVVMAAGAGLCGAVPALAQDNGSYFPRDVAVGVRERARPDYAALGIPLGAFQFYPMVAVTPGYDDNIFAVDKNKMSDVVTTIAPSVSVRSNWTRHEIDASAGSTSHVYASHSDQDTTDYQFAASGRLDVGIQSNVTAGASYSHVTVPRTAVDSISTGQRPVQYDQSAVNVSAVQVLSRLRFTEGFQLYRVSYGSSEQIAGNSSANLGYLGNTSYQVNGRADYALTPALAVFLATEVNKRVYDRTTSISMLDRSSDGFQVTIGSSVDITKLLKGQVRVGYLQQHYQSATFKTVRGPAAQIDLQYFPTELTTLTFKLSRAVVDAFDPRAISFLQTKLSVQADHELLPNVILSAKAGYENNAFRGIDREDDRPTASLSATYLLDRHLSLTGQYSFINQRSTGAARVGRYAVNVLSLAIVVQ